MRRRSQTGTTGTSLGALCDRIDIRGAYLAVIRLEWRYQQARIQCMPPCIECSRNVAALNVNSDAMKSRVGLWFKISSVRTVFVMTIVVIVAIVTNRPGDFPFRDWLVFCTKCWCDLSALADQESGCFGRPTCLVVPMLRLGLNSEQEMTVTCRAVMTEY